MTQNLHITFFVRRCLLLVCLLYHGILYGDPIENIVAENEPAVLIVEGTRTDGSATQSSGCVVDKNGLILTTAHQVESVSTLAGRQSDGTTFPLTIVEVDADRELALLRANRTFAKSVRIGDARALSAGGMLITIATPVNLDFSVATGIVANTSRTWRGYPVIQAEITAAPGSSGGPVFNRKGEVVGLIMGAIEEQQWATIILPINNAYSMLERHGVYQTQLMTDLADQELMPASNISPVELHALEAYNKGTRTIEPAEKKQHYIRAVELLPEFFEAWFNLAVSAKRAAENETAQSAYQRALKLRPDSVETRRNLGRLYLELGEYEAAIRLFEEAIDIQPEAPQSYNDLGEACRKAGRMDAAINAFQQAIARDEGYGHALYNLAITYVQQDNWELAYDAFDRYLAAAPDAADRERVENWLEAIGKRLQQQ